MPAPRSLIAAVEDAANRREPSLTARAASGSPRLVTPRAGPRQTSDDGTELHAGERVVVSSEGAAGRGGFLKVAGLAVLIILALVGVAALVRPFVGL